MITRRLVLALPAQIALLAAAPLRAQPDDALAAALVTCWQARGIRFTAEQVARRIGAHTGKAALLALAGATESADGEEVETAVEILWEAGQPPSPAEPLIARDLAARLPLLLLARDGQWWLLRALDESAMHVSHPATGQTMGLTHEKVALIGRPVIAGA